MRVKIPKYFRNGVASNKSLEQIRKEALNAEKWERRRKIIVFFSSVKSFFGRFIPNSKFLLSALRFILFILLTPVAIVAGAFSGIFVLPILLTGKLWDGWDNNYWPWEL
jgi:hypothetical protein